MCTQNKPCIVYISLHSIGISFEGCLYSLKNVEIPCTQTSPVLYIDLPHVKLTFLKNVAHGSFGYIDSAVLECTSGRKEVYVKRPIMPGKELFHEACVQRIVGESLKKIGSTIGVPEIARIFRLRDGSVCFAMDQIDGAMTLNKYLDGIPVSHFSSVIIDCLLQVIAMVWYLDTVLGINHRDLKPSNFLVVVEHDAPLNKILTIENEIIEISSKHSLTLIDFGFTCIGSELSLSTVYSKKDPCPKEGRDLFLFLGLLYVEYYPKLALELKTLFESWLHKDLCVFMRKDTENSKKWLYFMVGNEEIRRFNSTPLRILRDLNISLEMDTSI